MFKKILILLVAVMLLISGYGTVSFLHFNAITNGSVIPTYPVQKNALLVIDIQKDMTERDGKKPLNLNQTDSIIPVVNKLIECAGERDWLVVYITHEFKKNSVLRLVTRDFLLENLPGAKMDPRVLVVNKNHFIKNRMDTFSNKRFEDFLRENQVNQILVTGMAAEACVDKTCRSALKRGYKVIAINDAIAGSSDESRSRKLEEFQKYGARVVESDSLLQHWGLSR